MSHEIEQLIARLSPAELVIWRKLDGPMTRRQREPIKVERRPAPVATPPCPAPPVPDPPPPAPAIDLTELLGADRLGRRYARPLPQSKPVKVGQKTYPSIVAAAQALGLTNNALFMRIKRARERKAEQEQRRAKLHAPRPEWASA